MAMSALHGTGVRDVQGVAPWGTAALVTIVASGYTLPARLMGFTLGYVTICGLHFD